MLGLAWKASVETTLIFLGNRVKTSILLVVITVPVLAAANTGTVITTSKIDVFTLLPKKISVVSTDAFHARPSKFKRHLSQLREPFFKAIAVCDLTTF